ncbi:uncharacterized protein isoform X2 [Choristoneura fumiferana]|uniref:uncharacterized protein isoform X2 n=1 Tax=Choristoneura fumiferana TaxID=7141 RepID=UPI003D15AC72
MTQFALSWDAHKKNICSGLSYLQQNGEFVDMTLAADGHSVKVHQMIIALASPYIKELIASAHCPHPIIFLNRISYSTLCSILEYIYTGEVIVSSENLEQLIEAGRELHIKGLEDMKMNHSSMVHHPAPNPPSVRSQNEDDDVCFFEITDDKDKTEKYQLYTHRIIHDDKEETILSTIDNVQSVDQSFIESLQDEDMKDGIVTMTEAENSIPDANNHKIPAMQYTVSNQGSLQMILNRFVYYLKHTNRNNTRQWRCVDYVTSIKCPAHVVTKDNHVIQRISAHTHPFHDKRILKKVHSGAIFSAIQDAEKQCSVVGICRGKQQTK